MREEKNSIPLHLKSRCLVGLPNDMTACADGNSLEVLGGFALSHIVVRWNWSGALLDRSGCCCDPLLCNLDCNDTCYCCRRRCGGSQLQLLTNGRRFLTSSFRSHERPRQGPVNIAFPVITKLEAPAFLFHRGTQPSFLFQKSFYLCPAAIALLCTTLWFGVLLASSGCFAVLFRFFSPRLPFDSLGFGGAVRYRH